MANILYPYNSYTSKIKVDQMIPSSYIIKLAVGLYFMILHLISYFHDCSALFWG